MHCAAEPKARTRRHGRRTSALQILLTPCASRASGALPRAARLELSSASKAAVWTGAEAAAAAAMRWRLVAAVTALAAGSAWLAPSLRRPRSAPLFHRCMVLIETCGKAHVRESGRRGQRGRAGGLGWLGSRVCRPVLSVGVLLLLSVLRHHRCVARALSHKLLLRRVRARERKRARPRCGRREGER